MEEKIDWNFIKENIKAVNQFIFCPNCKRTIWQDENENALMIENATFTCIRCSLTFYLKPKLLKNHKKTIEFPRISEEKIVELIEDSSANVFKIITSLINKEYLDYGNMVEFTELLDKEMGKQALEEKQIMEMDDFEAREKEREQEGQDE